MIRLKGELRENPNLACLFCKRTTDNEHVYGKIYTLKDITCHYFCVVSEIIDKIYYNNYINSSCCNKISAHEPNDEK